MCLVKGGILSLVMALQSQVAFAAYNIGTSGGARGIEKFEAYFQDWINFATGPYALAVVVVSVVAAVTIFVCAPKQGPMAIFARAAIGGIVLINITSFIAGFTA
ncbi:hypothetical protein O4H49_20070 [Kiloniella laminariae]|uniref:Conjugal transfer protein TrbC n=1 Tax=Kiloniella laminariae TaxID=454162 RepID=A0ABT4LT38_9PROT|nr:hypothetical protein [Kiloniella laminariae]MCZ4283092.1 hypothetical protein [Kiloniella laminariae]